MENKTHNLELFRILYLVKGILTLLVSFVPLAYILLGGFIGLFDEISEANDQLPFDPGVIFMTIGLVGFVIILAIGIITLVASSSLNSKKNYELILAAAIINCFTGVLGILLGVFTIVELTKPNVKELFGKL